MHNPLRGARRKIVAGVIAGGLIVGGAGSAFAFYLTEASGSATASAPLGAGGGTTPVSVTVDALTSPISPGGSEPITFSVANQSTGTTHLGGVAISVTGALPAGCDPSWFTVTPGTLAYSDGSGKLGTNGLSGELASGQAVNDVNSPATAWQLNFTETGTDQSACEAGHISLSAVAS